jgi:hypothetical protein
MIAREEARLRALFQRLLLLSAATSPLACSASGRTKSAGANDAGLDAETGPDAGQAISDSACDPVVVDAAEDGSGCTFLETLPCGLPPGATTQGCYVDRADCLALCDTGSDGLQFCATSECLATDGSTLPSAPPLTLECTILSATCQPPLRPGRRPEGLLPASPARSGDAIGAVLADSARLEAASVHAFVRLGSELASMGAPRSLARAAERSAREEVRHARVMSRLARRHGAVPAPVRIGGKRRARSLEAFAIENAVEGCVRESFGALVAMRQSLHARDPELAREMGSIARDETRHAALAWEIARWIEPRLSVAARARAEQAMGDAFAALRREVESTPADLACVLGLPAGRDGAALVDAFEAALVSRSTTGS